MKIRYDVDRILSGEFAQAKTANNKNNCCNEANKTKTALTKWRESAQKSTRQFLESQFGKSLEDFDRGDWRLVKTRCLKFLPKDKKKLIESKGGGRTPTTFYTQLSAKPSGSTSNKSVTDTKKQPAKPSTLPEREALKLLKSIFRKDVSELTFAQKRRIIDSPEIVSLLSAEFVKKYNLHPGRYQNPNAEAPEKKGRTPSIVDFVKKLPNDASLDRLNKVLLSLPLRSNKGTLNPDTGRVEFSSKVVWDKFIARRNELPEAMKVHYARELKFIKGKRGRKPKHIAPKTMIDIDIEQENLERAKRKLKQSKPSVKPDNDVIENDDINEKKTLKVVRKEPPANTTTKPSKTVHPVKKPKTTTKRSDLDNDNDDGVLDDDVDLSDVSDDDLSSLLGNRPKKVTAPKVDKVEEVKFLPTDSDVIKFINTQMNKALLPDEYPRSSTTPTSQWSTSEWALVDVYRDRINQKFLDNNREKIDNALRKLGRAVNANFRTISRTDTRMALSLIRFHRMFSQGDLSA